MKANELRIGNWYLSFGVDLKQVESITKDKILIDFHPIPLTEEWLLKFGFDSHKSSKELLFGSLICLERQMNELFIVNPFDKHQYKIDYVHQLQNLYFALTGEELEIK